MINVHASLLPRHRGAAPIQRAILEGDRETGVTIMRVVKALDAGAMLAARRTPLDPDETGGDLETRLAEMGARLLVETLDPLERGTLVEVPQDEAQATYAGRITKTDGVISWDAPARAIHDRVRGLSPWPHAFTYHEGTRYVVHETRPFDGLAAAWRAAGHTPLEGAAAPLRPGVVLDAPRGRLFVGAAERTVVEIVRLQEEGRRVLAARDFLAGRPLPTGLQFESSDPT
jgi:methionyl-tRNA formyltransferase